MRPDDPNKRNAPLQSSTDARNTRCRLKLLNPFSGLQGVVTSTCLNLTHIEPFPLISRSHLSYAARSPREPGAPMSEMRRFQIRRVRDGLTVEHIGTAETAVDHASFLSGHFGEPFSVVPPATPAAAPRASSISPVVLDTRSRASA